MTWNLVILIVVLTLLSQAYAAVLAAGDAKADEAQCAQLRSLNQQYRGVVLSPSDKVAKAKMVSWYRSNCGKKSKGAK